MTVRGVANAITYLTCADRTPGPAWAHARCTYESVPHVAV